MRNLTNKEKSLLENIQNFIDNYLKFKSAETEKEYIKYLKKLSDFDIPENPFKGYYEKYIDLINKQYQTDKIDYNKVFKEKLKLFKQGKKINKVKTPILDRIVKMKEVSTNLNFTDIAGDAMAIVFSGGKKSHWKHFVIKDDLPNLKNKSLLNKKTKLPKLKIYSFPQLLMLLQSLYKPEEVNLNFILFYLNKEKLINYFDDYLYSNDIKQLEKALNSLKDFDLPKGGPGTMFRGIPLKDLNDYEKIAKKDKVKKYLPVSRSKKIAKNFALGKSTGLYNTNAGCDKGIVEVWEIKEKDIIIDLNAAGLSVFNEGEVIINPKRAKLKKTYIVRR